MRKFINALALVALLPVSVLLGGPVGFIIWILLVWSNQSYFNKQELIQAIKESK